MVTKEKPTSMARRMLIELIGREQRYSEIAEQTGMLPTSVRSLACSMRKTGELPKHIPVEYEYVGTSDKLGVVRFKSLSAAHAEGFYSSMVSKAVNGIIESYAGYKWERVYK